jgi:hypothetical protein
VTAPRIIRNEGEAYAIAREMLQEEHVFPTQIGGGHRNDSLLSGEKALMLAILEDAIRCYQGHLKAARIHPRKLERQAVDWLASPEEEYLYSFISICNHLGFDPGALRRRLVQSRAESTPTSGKFYRLHLRVRRRKGN